MSQNKLINKVAQQTDNENETTVNNNEINNSHADGHSGQTSKRRRLAG